MSPWPHDSPYGLRDSNTPTNAPNKGSNPAEIDNGVICPTHSPTLYVRTRPSHCQAMRTPLVPPAMRYGRLFGT